MEWTLSALEVAVSSAASFVSNFGGAAQSGFERQHLIPTESADRSWVLRALSIIDSEPVYKHNDFASNGIWLGDNPKTSFSLGLAQHSGSHPAYSRFVLAVLQQLETSVRADIAERISRNISEEQAIRGALIDAKATVETLQLYLKSGLVSQWDAENNRLSPTFLLHGTDQFAKENMGANASQRILYQELGLLPDKIQTTPITLAEQNSAWTRFIESKVSESESFREALRNSSAWYDPNAVDANGNRLSPFERAALMAEIGGDANLAALLRSTKASSLSHYANLIKGFLENESGSVDPLKAGRLFGLIGLGIGAANLTAEAAIYVHNLPEDNEAAFKQMFNDLASQLTLENAANVAIGIGVAALAAGLAAFLFGEIGVCLLIGGAGLLSLRDLYDNLVELRETFPDWEWLGPVVDNIDSIVTDIERILPDFNFSLPTVVIADGEMTAHADDKTDFVIGYDKATLEGGASNDVLIQFGVGDVNGGDGKDLIIAIGSANIDGGNGNDIVLSFGANSEIDLGAGDDLLLHAGEGSIVHGGAGKDTFLYTDGILIDDAGSLDSVSYYGLKLGTALSFGAVEGGWAEFGGALGLVRASTNSAGQLGLQDLVSMIRQSMAGASDDDQNYYMFFSNFNRDPLAEPEDRTAGMRLANIEIGAYQILKGPSPEDIALREEHSTWELMAQMLGELDDLKDVDTCTVDPLALDLDGDGLELSSRTGLAPYFDIDGDGFLERSGWVRGDDGLLVADANGNGKVDGFGELFGSPTASGFVELKTYDSNLDGKVDGSDSKFAELLVWQDKDADGVTDAGELRSLTELGITSINVTATAVTKTNAGNLIAAEGTFTKSDGSTGTISDVRFDANQYDSKYTGDSSVDPTIATTMPNLKGHGTLANLHVALTQNPTGVLANAIATALPTLNVLDITELRDRALPILQAWAQTPLDGVPALPGGANPDIAILVDRSEVRTDILNFAMQVTETVDINGTPTEVTYWKLASGQAHDAQGNVIQYPTLAQILAQVPGDPAQEWDVMQGTTLDFLERYFGANIPFDDADIVQGGAIGPISDFLEKAESAVELLSIRLAMQGPLAPYFEGVSYDVAEDCFRPTTDRQLTPMFEAIFGGAPGGFGSTTDWLDAWQPILDAAILDYERGRSNLVNSYAFIFTCIVAAYENVGLDIDAKAAAVALGLPGDLINVGSGVREGTNENDIFYMAAGDDVAKGGVGPDTYVFGKNFGHDVIEDVETGGNDFDQIRFAHLKPDEVTAYREGKDLKLVADATGDTILVKGHFFDIAPSLFGGNALPKYGADEIIFADGTVWDRMTIALKVSHPDDPDQTIIGTDQVDVLDGGKGNDTLVGGNNSDVYVFGKGYGQDVMDDSAGDYNVLVPTGDILMFKDGVNRDDVTFSRGTDINDLIIKINGTDDQVRINNQFSATYTGVFGTHWFSRIDNFAFANGEQVTWDQIIEQMNREAGTDGNDTIAGFDYKDTLDGGKGNDTLSGGNESDTYLFDFGYGNDVIDENLDNILSGNEDRIVFGTDVKVSDVSISRVGSTDDLLLTLSDGSTLRVHDQFQTYLGEGIDFDRIERIEFASDPGATIHWHQLFDMLLQAAKTDGGDTIYGFERADTIDGGAGNDTLSGGDGSDTYIFNLGSGHDKVFDLWHDPIHSDNDVVQFGAGITLEDLDIVRSGEDLVLTVKSTGDTLTLLDQLHYNQVDLYGVESFKFADGTVLGEEYFRAQLIRPTAGDDVIVGTSWADTIAGGAGNDSLDGGNGSDTYLYARGDGHDTITDGYDGGTCDKLIFNGVNPSEVTLVRNGNDVTLVIAESAPGAGDAGTVLLKHSLDDYLDRGVEQIVFADGTIWTRSDVRPMLLAQASTAASDTISGFSVADTITGGEGNDAIAGGDGSDTYVYARGDGNDSITESYDSVGKSGKADKLVFTDINPQDVSLVRNGNDVTLVIAESAPGAGDAGSILLKDGLSSFYWTGVEQIVFASGTVWTQADLRSMLVDVAGTPGDDTIAGFSTIDIVAGGKGNDTLAGGDGSDTYLYARGDGNDTITESYDSLGKSGKADQLVFADVNASDVSLVRNGNTVTLVIAESAPGASDGGSIVLNSGLSGFYWTGVENISFADGTTWTQQDMREMLLAAASTDGDDTIVGFYHADDVITGGKGNDTINGGEGDDTYIYNRGDGNDTVTDLDAYNFDKVVLHGVNPANVTLGRSGDTAILIIAESAPGAGDGGAITMPGTYFNFLGAGIDQILFDDGTIWTQAMLRTMWLAQASTSGNDQISGFRMDDTIIGEEGNDTIGGADGSDTITGGAGDDMLNGNDSSDTYIYGRGDGNDTISESIFSGSGDKLILNGIYVSDVSLARSGNDATLLIHESAPGAGDSGSVKLVTSFVIGGNDGGVEQVIFADGTIWTPANLRAQWFAQVRTDGDDNIVGFSTSETVDGAAGNDTLNGGGGVDTLIGGTGNDSYVIDGDDVVVENEGEGTDTVTIAGSYTIGANLENLILSGTSGYSGTGNELDNGITGNSGANTLTGGAGNDTLDGAAGADKLFGGLGDDLYVVDNAGDVVTENADEGTELVKSSVGLTLAANVENLTLTGTANINGTGNSLANIILGNSGNNVLDGSTGADSLTGGAGNDTYLVDDIGDVTAESADEGTDLVQSAVTYALAANIENLSLTGAAAIDGTGNVLDNYLVGNSAANTLSAEAGNDTLDGAAGADILTGDAGNDTYLVENAGDATVENADEGVDLVQSSITWTLAANVENLTLTGSAAINGTGNELDNMLIGNSGANALSGAAGNDVLNGGTGADTLTGGAGDDSYFVDNASDVTTESADEGIDSVQSSVTWTLAQNFEHLTLTGTANINGTGNAQGNSILGTSGNNVLDGSAGADTVKGGLGNDTYIVDDSADVVVESAGEGIDVIQAAATFVLSENVENLVLTGTSAINGTGNDLGNALTGSSGANQLTGGAGNDTINGAAGADTLLGGIGDDICMVDNAGDVVTEFAGEGTDLVQSSVTHALTAEIEYLTLTGGSNISGSGNALNNAITGNIGQNVLDGGLGADTLSGGGSHDTYIVDNVDDVVIEFAGSGTDVVKSSVTYTLTENVENLTLTGTLAIDGTGNALNNSITGNDGDNTLVGVDGNDALSGGAGNDTIGGGSGDDTLNGGAGLDILTGGSGNDTYVVDNPEDIVSELENEGIDTVQSSITYILSGTVENLTLTGSASIDGTGNGADNILNGTGGANTLTGGTGNDTLSGGNGNDVLFGGDGDDKLYGSNHEDKYYGGAGDDWLVADLGQDYFDGGDGVDTGDFRYLNSASTLDLANNGGGEILLSIENLYSGSGADTLYGSAVGNYINGGAGNDTINGREGNDTLDGAAGNDILSGGIGNDLYLVDAAGDTIIENADEGIDSVQSSVAWTLGANIENLALTGTGAINGTGNALNNVITGNSGSNTLAGGDSNDTLEGGAGNDTLQGGNGNDRLRWDASDLLDGGSGVDTLLYAEAGDLDFNALNVTNIEAINLGIGDDNNNGIILSTSDVLDLAASSSGTNLSANDDTIDLFIFGDNEGPVVDNVTLTGGWTASGTITTADVTGTSTTFNLYIAGTSQVAVQQDLDAAAA